MENTRRVFLQHGALAVGTAVLVGSSPMSAESLGSMQPEDTSIESQEEVSAQQIPAGTGNVLGGDHFDPSKWLVVPPRTFKDLQVGDVFRAPSRTLTAAHTSEFQAVSCDTHPRHYNDDYAKSHGMPAALIQPFQLLAFTAPGATLFTHYVGESIEALAEVSCKFGPNCYTGDTLYPALEIAELSTKDGKGHVTMAIVIYNHRGQVVLSGYQKFVLKLA